MLSRLSRFWYFFHVFNSCLSCHVLYFVFPGSCHVIPCYTHVILSCGYFALCVLFSLVLVSFVLSVHWLFLSCDPHSLVFKLLSRHVVIPIIFKMTTRDVLLCAVHILRLEIMHFYGNTNNAKINLQLERSENSKFSSWNFMILVITTVNSPLF